MDYFSPRAHRRLGLLDDALPEDVEGVAVRDVDESAAGVAAVLPGVRQRPPPPRLHHEALPHAGVPLVPPPTAALADVAVLLRTSPGPDRVLHIVNLKWEDTFGKMCGSQSRPVL